MKSKLARFGGAAMAATLLVLTACNASDNKSATAPSAKNWTEFRDQFLAGYFPLNPNFAVYQGKHEFDGQLPDWSPEGLEKQAAYLEKAIADAKAFDGTMTDAENSSATIWSMSRKASCSSFATPISRRKTRPSTPARSIPMSISHGPMPMRRRG